MSLLLAQSKGLPLRVVAAGNSTTGKQGADFAAMAVPADSPLKTAKDLEGKTASSNTLNNIGDLCIRASVRKAGGDPSKVKFIEVGFPDVPAALAEKRLDAAFAVEPALTVVKSQGAVVIAWPFVDCSRISWWRPTSRARNTSTRTPMSSSASPPPSTSL